MNKKPKGHALSNYTSVSSAVDFNILGFANYVAQEVLNNSNSKDKRAVKLITNFDDAAVLEYRKLMSNTGTRFFMPFAKLEVYENGVLKPNDAQLHQFTLDVIDKLKNDSNLSLVGYKNGYIYIKSYDGKYFNISSFKDLSYNKSTIIEEEPQEPTKTRKKRTTKKVEDEQLEEEVQEELENEELN